MVLRLKEAKMHALILEMDMWAVAFLRDFQLQTPAQTKDADQRFLVETNTL